MGELSCDRGVDRLLSASIGLLQVAHTQVNLSCGVRCSLLVELLEWSARGVLDVGYTERLCVTHARADDTGTRLLLMMLFGTC